MTSFRTIKGLPIKTISGDRTAAAPSSFESQLYYDSDGVGIFKFIGALAAGTWASGGALNDARNQCYGAGTQTAAMACGGESPGVTAATELYNGSSWTEVNNLNTARLGHSNTGTQTSAIAAGGLIPNTYQSIVESWNGTNWTEVADINTARGFLGLAGADNTSAIGYAGQSPQRALAEVWNGTGWTEVGDLNSARHAVAGTGSATAAICIGGNPPLTVNTEIWNGTNWTEVNNMNTATAANAASGIVTAALTFGGTPVPGGTGVKTEDWNGTSWTEVNNLSTGRNDLGGIPGTSGSSQLALAIGGSTPGFTAVTEEWTVAHAIKTIDLS